jgi:hypothetical protein
MSETPAGGEDCEIIHVPNRLAEKVGPISVDPVRLKKAEEAVAKLAELYPERLVAEVRLVRETWETLRANPEDEDAARRLRRCIHDIKGQAATFSYPLATEIASAIRGLVAAGMTGIPKGPDVIDAHVNALAVIANERLMQDGGPAGQALVSGLRQAREKIGFNLLDE